MKIVHTETKEKLVQRLRRIEGQVRGVQSMIEDERDCREIIQQLSAIRAAMQGASRLFLQEYAVVCLNDMENPAPAATEMNERGKREKLVRDMIELLDKAP